jgi:sulfofructose kinase
VTTPTPSIVCLGHAALDRIYSIAAFPPTPQKTRAHTVEEVGGGMAANAAVAAARLGASVAFIGRIGDDLAGTAIRDGLAREHIDTTQLRICPAALSSTSAVIVDATGERLLVNHRGTNLPDDPAWLDLTPVATARVVLADVRWPRGALALFRAARAAGITTVLDGDIGAGDTLPELLSLADYALFSTPGLAEFTPGDPAAALARARTHGPRHAGVSQGGHGYLWIDDTGTHHRPAFPITPQDTSGAGDAFHGGFVWALSERLETEACVRIAQATAALKCHHPGNRAGLPTRPQLQAFLTHHHAR